MIHELEYFTNNISKYNEVEVQDDLDKEILDAATGLPSHWCEKENSYVFTVDEYNEEVIQNKIKL